MEIRKVTEEDVNWIVNLHRAVLPNDLLPMLGPKFMQSLYNHLIYQADVKFLCTDVGFGIFSLDRLWFDKLILTKQLWPTVKNLVIRPKLWFNVLHYFFGYNMEYMSNAHQPILSDFNLWVTKTDYIGEIEFLAVLPEYQNKGVGRQLIEEGLKGKDRWVAKTLKIDVRFFYQTLGFEWIGIEKRMGRDYYVLYKKN